jgi:hypothetical protein
LLKATLEVLADRYPDIEIYQYSDFYDEYNLKVDDKIISLKRGHGLGMANSLTTLYQIVLHYLTLLEAEEQNEVMEGQCGILVFNDDFVAGIKSE